jgi:DNA-binding MarR family transcriptional regulator
MAARRNDKAEAEFAAALDVLFRAVLRATGRGVPGGDTELTLSQYNVLSAVGERPSTVSEVARVADVAVPTATRALRALEQRGFVRRRRKTGHDGRVVTIALTDEGGKVLAEKTAWVRARQRAIFDGLGDAERRTAAGLLERIAADIDEL